MLQLKFIRTYQTTYPNLQNYPNIPFSVGELPVSSNKLIALLAIAKTYSRSAEHYETSLAGSWKEIMPRSLSWLVETPTAIWMNTGRHQMVLVMGVRKRFEDLWFWAPGVIQAWCPHKYDKDRDDSRGCECPLWACYWRQFGARRQPWKAKRCTGKRKRKTSSGWLKVVNGPSLLVSEDTSGFWE